LRKTYWEKKLPSEALETGETFGVLQGKIDAIHEFFYSCGRDATFSWLHSCVIYP
jgi:hypothetical protein